MDEAIELAEMNELFDRLFPICRSITGDGLRETISILTEYMPLESFNVPTGTSVFDWEIPKEWVIRGGWLKGPDGKKIVDFETSNLHILNYSTPINIKLSLSDLQDHLYSIPELPEAVPYVTSYYKERWGFCLTHQQREQLVEGEYHAYIDSEHIDGELNFAHAVLPGDTDREVLISTYICHPSIANNELSGPIVSAYLYKRISEWTNRRFTYRFVFIPETIGSISYLHKFGGELKEKLHSGLVLTCLGGSKELSYKMSRSGANPIDRLWGNLISSGELKGDTRPFTPTHGSDERQYCSPGFNLPVGQMARTVYGGYEGYHNSLDTKEFMTIEALHKSLKGLELLLIANEADGFYINLNPFGEVKLDKHGLYPDINSPTSKEKSSNDITDQRTQLNDLLTVLNYSDGNYSLSDIADICKCSIFRLLPIVENLKEKGIITGPLSRKE